MDKIFKMEFKRMMEVNKKLFEQNRQFLKIDNYNNNNNNINVLKWLTENHKELVEENYRIMGLYLETQQEKDKLYHCNQKLVECNEESIKKLDLLKEQFETMLEKDTNDLEEAKKQLNENNNPYTIIMVDPVNDKCILSLQNFDVKKYKELTLEVNGVKTISIDLVNQKLSH